MRNFHMLMCCLSVYDFLHLILDIACFALPEFSQRYKDEYREALLKVIDSKVAGQPVEAPAPEPEASKLTDLMAVLEASVAAARSERSDAKAERSDAPDEPISVEKARKTRGRSGKAAGTKSSAGKSSAGKSKRATKPTSKSSSARKRKTA